MALKLQNQSLGRMTPEAFKASPKHPLVLVLDNVRSLHNVGSAFRTADAFLVEEIILCGSSGTPPAKEIEKTALGATATVKWSYVSSTAEAITRLRQNGYLVYAVEQAEGSTRLNDFAFGGKKTALVFGNEVYGVEQDILNMCEGVVEIPQFGTKHSLNISVAVGIVLWEIVKDLKGPINTL
ncbi:MAG TPA: RNA methyltransferase [Bacteroidia bacterium]|nr:RNA methyltransferase [Bacteroidia bacterium]